MTVMGLPILNNDSALCPVPFSRRPDLGQLQLQPGQIRISIEHISGGKRLRCTALAGHTPPRPVAGGSATSPGKRRWLGRQPSSGAGRSGRVDLHHSGGPAPPPNRCPGARSHVVCQPLTPLPTPWRSAGAGTTDHYCVHWFRCQSA